MKTIQTICLLLGMLLFAASMNAQDAPNNVNALDSTKIINIAGSKVGFDTKDSVEIIPWNQPYIQVDLHKANFTNVNHGTITQQSDVNSDVRIVRLLSGTSYSTSEGRLILGGIIDLNGVIYEGDSILLTDDQLIIDGEIQKNTVFKFLGKIIIYVPKEFTIVANGTTPLTLNGFAITGTFFLFDNSTLDAKEDIRDLKCYTHQKAKAQFFKRINNASFVTHDHSAITTMQDVKDLTAGAHDQSYILGYGKIWTAHCRAEDVGKIRLTHVVEGTRETKDGAQILWVKHDRPSIKTAETMKTAEPVEPARVPE
jgi:hypothetical protein